MVKEGVRCFFETILFGSTLYAGAKTYQQLKAKGYLPCAKVGLPGVLRHRRCGSNLRLTALMWRRPIRWS